MKNAKKVLLFGLSDFAEIVHENIKAGYAMEEYACLGYVIDDEYLTPKNAGGGGVEPYSELKKLFNPQEVAIIVCIGYSRMNKLREKIYERLRRDNWEIVGYTDKRAIVNSSDLGIGNIILDGVNIGVKCRLGDGNIFYPNSLLAHHSVVGNFNFFAISSSIAGDSIIGNRCFFGNNCCTKEKLHIADKTLLGAGCYLRHDVNSPSLKFTPPELRVLTDTYLDE